MDMAVLEVLLCLFFISRVVWVMVNYQKILSCEEGYSAYGYEYTYHLVCLNNSYYQEPMWIYSAWSFCCNSPLLGRKGVRENEIF